VLPRKRGEYESVDFTGKYTVAAVTVSGAAPDAGGFAFANSRIAGYRVGNVRLAGVQPENRGREFGVAGYYLSRVQRRFGGPDGPDLTRKEFPPTNRFRVSQIYVKPLVFHPSTGTYATGSAMISLTDYVRYTGGWTGTRTFTVPAEGIQVGTVANHPSGAATVSLNPDGSYDARTADGTVVAQHATLAGLALALAGTPGTSMKIVDVPVTPGSSTTTYAAGSISLLSTSVSAEVSIAIQGTAIFRTAAGAEYRLPTGDEVRTAIEGLGTPVQAFKRPLLKVREAAVLIGRRFDDDRGARSLMLSPALGLMFQSPGQPDEQVEPDVAAALIGDLARLGSGRHSVLVHTGPTGLTLTGLGDGGTAVIYAASNAAAINPGGATLDFPTATAIVSRLQALDVSAWSGTF
jgi:hypothetical protein